jgi:hypothetical protein
MRLFVSSLCFGLSLLVAAVVPTRADAEFMRRTSEDALVHWDRPTVRLPIDPNLATIYGPEIYDALADAADAWALDSGVPRIELVFEGTPEEHAAAAAEKGNWIGVITENWPYGDQLAVTVSTIGAQSGRLVSTQVWINAQRPLALEVSGEDHRYDLRGVLTHELGHVLGLGEAEHAPEATMYPTFRRGETRQRTLARSDELAVTNLYAIFDVQFLSTSCAASPIPRTTGTRAFLVGISGLVAGYGRTRRRRRGRRPHR